MSNNEAKEQYNAYLGEINEISDEISSSIKIRSKCDWYEFGEKLNKFFLTTEKRRAMQNIVHKVLSNEQELTDLSKINTYHPILYSFLNDLTVPSLTTEKSLSWKGN